MVSSFEMPILPPSLSKLQKECQNQNQNQRKLPKINLQHSLTNHS